MRKLLLVIVLLVGILYAQEIDLKLDIVEPNYGLAITGTGMTLCMIGTTMSQNAQVQYSPIHGPNYISYNDNNRGLRLSTMAVGALITVTGIILQNRKRKSS